MNKWFNWHLPNRKTIEKSVFFKKYQKYLGSRDLWRFDWHRVAKGVAVGLFSSMIPIFPIQTVLAVLLAVLLRANIPFAIFGSWLNNPFTFLPITYFTFFIGELVLNEEHQNIVIHDFTWKSNNLADLWSSAYSWLLQFSKAFFVGVPFVAIGSAILGYVLVILIWRISEFIKQKQKK